MRSCGHHAILRSPTATISRVTGALAGDRVLVGAGLAVAAATIGYASGIDPAYGLATSLALAFVLVAMANLYARLIAFILLTFVSDIPGFLGPGVTASKAAGVVLVISWLAHLARRKEARADLFSAHPAAAWILVFFVGWGVLSLTWAESPGNGLEALFRISLNAIFFMIVFTAVRTRGQAIGVLGAFLAGACLNALYGLINPVHVANTARFATSSSKPGELAAALVAGLVLGVALTGALKGKPGPRFLVALAVPLCAVGILFTGSRGGLIALTVALAGFIVVGAKWRGRIVVLAAIVVIAGLGFYTYAASPDLRDRVTSVGSGSGRIDLWTVGWRMVEGDPVQGVGIGNFPVASPDYVLVPGTVARPEYVSYKDKVAHNTYLELWAETGLVGLTLFAGLVIFCVRSSLRAARAFAARGDPPMELLSRGLFVAQLGFLAGAFFTSREYQKDVWLILALGPTLLAVASSARARGPEEGEVDRAAGSPRPQAAPAR
jgi:O-antigen ligase